jgi:hypothetical protein
MLAYSGKWTVDDEKLVTQVDGAWDPTGSGWNKFATTHSGPDTVISYRANSTIRVSKPEVVGLRRLAARAIRSQEICTRMFVLAHGSWSGG